jgi:hypothetical protein
MARSIFSFLLVAKVFRAEEGLTYLAGAWAESVPYCLLRSSRYDFIYITDHVKTSGQELYQCRRGPGSGS